MPFRRRFRPRTRRIARRRRFVRRRSRAAIGIRRSMVSSGNMLTHRFKRTMSITDNANGTTSAVSLGVGGSVNWNPSSDAWDVNTGTGNVTNYVTQSFSFSLGLLPDSSDFTALYDSYCITGIKIKITPFSATSQLQQGTTLANNQALSVVYHSLVDPDDRGTFTAGASGINSMREYPTYKTRNFYGLGKPITRFFKPRLAIGVYDANGTATSRLNSGPRFIDMVYTNVEHFAYKHMLEFFQPDSTVPCYIWWKAEAKVYLSCRTPR